MKREWNVPLVESDPAADAHAANALSAVAEPDFLGAAQAAISGLTANGEKLCIATDRGKYDADGNRVDGKEGAGTFRTNGYVFQLAETTWTVERDPAQEGSPESLLLASTLSTLLCPDALRSLLDVKVILDRFGGQVWIAPFVRGDEVIGLAFHYAHISKIARGQEPDADIASPLPLVIAGD